MYIYILIIYDISNIYILYMISLQMYCKLKRAEAKLALRLSFFKASESLVSRLSSFAPHEELERTNQQQEVMNSKLKLCREAKSGGLFLTISSGNPIHQWYKGNYTDEKTGATYVIGYWIHVYKVYIYIDIGGVLDNIEYWSRIGLNFEQCF